MKKNMLVGVVLILSLSLLNVNPKIAYAQKALNHYGMPIEEIKKSYKQRDAALDIIYSNIMSDDNMDNYVRRFYDEFLRLVESWLYSKTLPASNMRIEISNCKFCKIGYCKMKNVKEISMVLYVNDKKASDIVFKHADIIDRTQYQKLAQQAVAFFFEK